MATVEFHYTEDEEYGGMGWIPLKQPKFNASEGLGVAHDTMEHFTLDGTMEEEMLAFGSIFYIRVETGLLLQNNYSGYSPGKILAGDVSGFFRNAWGEGANRILKPYQGRPRHLESYLEHDLEELCLHAMRQLRDEIGDYGTATEWQDFRAANPSIEDNLKRWIRAGYWKCKARYRGASCHDLADAFDTLVRKVKDIKCPDYGDRLRCTVQVKGTRPVVSITRTESWAL
jgi:hypothetical protein